MSGGLIMKIEIYCDNIGDAVRKLESIKEDHDDSDPEIEPGDTMYCGDVTIKAEY